MRRISALLAALVAAVTFAVAAAPASAHVLDCGTARNYANGFYGDNDVMAEVRSGVDPGDAYWWWGGCDRPYGSQTYQEHRMIVEIVFPTRKYPQGVRSRVWVMFRDGGIVDNPNYLGPPAGW